MGVDAEFEESDCQHWIFAMPDEDGATRSFLSARPGQPISSVREQAPESRWLAAVRNAMCRVLPFWTGRQGRFANRGNARGNLEDPGPLAT